MKASIPHNVEAEKGLLCAMWLKPSLALEPQIRENLFWVPAHRLIFSALQKLALCEGKLDFPMLVIELKKAGDLEEIGGREYLVELVDFVPSAAGWKHYLDACEESYRVREAVIAAQKILSLTDPDEQAEVADAALKRIAAPVASDLIPMKERMHQTFDWLEESRHRHNESVIRFGLPQIDSLIRPVEPGDQIVICAETGVGKTALAGQAVTETKEGKFLVFSLEMMSRTVIIRMLSNQSSVPVSNIRRAELSKEQHSLLWNSAKDLSLRDIWIDDTRPVDIRSICSRARAVKQRHGLTALVVDYLQLVTPVISRRESNREREVAEISRALKSLALDLGITVIALSQLNDHGQMRESRAIGQDADIVLHIKREGEIQIGKNRNGPEKTIATMFDGATMRFWERENQNGN